MLFRKTLILFLSLCIAFYAHSASNGEDSNMIKLGFVLKITDENKYLEYRNKIKPLMNTLNIVVLKEYRISTVVHSDDETENVNLMAMFAFPDLETKENFFASDVYQDAKQLFNESTTNFEKLIE